MFKFFIISQLVLATPATRHLIKKHRLDHTKITATGTNGRIMKEDVLNYIKNKDNVVIQNITKMYPHHHTNKNPKF